MNTHHRMKKSLGQHFLRSTKALRDIVEAGSVSGGDLVLEIGPGDGALTAELLGSGARVVAIEKDDALIPRLSERFANEITSGRFRLIHGDVMSAPLLAALFAQGGPIGRSRYKLIANIPYYITGALFRIFLEDVRQPSILVFLVQHEVALQLARNGGKESIASIAVKLFGNPTYIARVKSGAFFPPPKVDSAILRVDEIIASRDSLAPNESVLEIAKMAFSAKRKMMLNNLAQKLKWEKEALAEVFAASNIPLRARAEDLSIMQWVDLTRRLRHPTSTKKKRAT